MPTDHSSTYSIPIAETVPIQDVCWTEESASQLSPRPARLTATAIKPYPRSNAGVSITRIDNSLRIREVDPEGIFGGSDLQVGDMCLSINGIFCGDKSAAFAADLIRNANAQVTIQVQTSFPVGEVVNPQRILAKVTKERDTDSIGLVLTDREGKVVITEFNPMGMAATTKLCLGDICIAINGVRCIDAKFGASVIRNAVGSVSIEADRWSAEGDCFQGGGETSQEEIHINKPYADALVGIVLKRVANYLIVDGIKQDSLFAGTALRTGDQVIAVNGQGCAGVTAAHAAILIRTSPFVVAITVKRQAAPKSHGNAAPCTSAEGVLHYL